MTSLTSSLAAILSLVCIAGCSSTNGSAASAKPKSFVATPITQTHGVMLDIVSATSDGSVLVTHDGFEDHTLFAYANDGTQLYSYGISDASGFDAAVMLSDHSANVGVTTQTSGAAYSSMIHLSPDGKSSKSTVQLDYHDTGIEDGTALHCDAKVVRWTLPNGAKRTVSVPLASDACRLSADRTAFLAGRCDSAHGGDYCVVSATPDGVVTEIAHIGEWEYVDLGIGDNGSVVLLGGVKGRTELLGATQDAPYTGLVLARLDASGKPEWVKTIGQLHASGFAVSATTGESFMSIYEDMNGGAFLFTAFNAKGNVDVVLTTSVFVNRNEALWVADDTFILRGDAQDDAMFAGLYIPFEDDAVFTLKVK